MHTFPIEEKTGRAADQHIKTEVGEAQSDGYRRERERRKKEEDPVEKGAKPLRQAAGGKGDPLVTETCPRTEQNADQKDVDLFPHLNNFFNPPFAP